MANNGRKRSGETDNSSLILGILIGMVIGLLVAGAVAWHLASRPKAFTLKDEAPHVATAPKVVPAAPAHEQPASGVNGNGKRFTFYEILTDKSHPPANVVPAPGGKTVTASKPAAGSAYFLQAGSFAKPDEADRLKAKLAMMGMEATVQQADVPGRGTYYRVRLGPYSNTDEMHKANATLKQNGITNAAPVRATR
jgi:cell division protein FtsN